MAHNMSRPKMPSWSVKSCTQTCKPDCRSQYASTPPRRIAQTVNTNTVSQENDYRDDAADGIPNKISKSTLIEMQQRLDEERQAGKHRDYYVLHVQVPEAELANPHHFSLRSGLNHCRLQTCTMEILLGDPRIRTATLRDVDNH
jgi:hypothetical protein